MIPQILAAVVGRGSPKGTVSFSSATVTTSVADPPCIASVTFNTDGTIDKSENGVTSQIGTWIDPVLGAEKHQIRFTALVGNELDEPTAAEDVWHPFSDGNFSCLQNNSVSSTTESSTFDIEIRFGTGSALDSAPFSLSAELT